MKCDEDFRPLDPFHDIMMAFIVYLKARNFPMLFYLFLVTVPKKIYSTSLTSIGRMSTMENERFYSIFSNHDPRHKQLDKCLNCYRLHFYSHEIGLIDSGVASPTDNEAA